MTAFPQSSPPGPEPFRSPEALFTSRDPPPDARRRPSSILRPPMARTRTWRRPVRFRTFKFEPDFASGLLERTDVDLQVQSNNALKY